MAYYTYPCRDCPDRAVGCHSKCEKYLAARQDHHKKAEVIYQEKKVEDGLYSYKYRKIAEQQRKLRNKNGR